MTELKTDASLLSALLLASSNAPTSEELQRQRVSFIMGAISDKSGVTRARVEEVLAEHEGRKGLIGDPV
jgi:hypothetical protein